MKTSKTLIGAMTLLALFSCNKTPEVKKTQEVTVNFDIKDNVDKTKSALPGASLISFSNASVAFYNKDGELVGDGATIEDMSITLSGIPTDQDCTVYAVANYKEWSWPDTEAAVKDLEIDGFDVLTISEKNVPMAGTTSWTAGASSLRVGFDRLVTRYAVSTYNEYERGTWTLTALNLYNTAKYVTPFQPSTDERVQNGDYATTIDITNLNDGKEVYFYAPENIGGNTRIEIKGVWKTGDGVNKEETYILYLKDYNERNASYNVILKASGEQSNWEFIPGEVIGERAVVTDSPYTRLFDTELAKHLSYYNPNPACNFTPLVDGEESKSMEYKLAVNILSSVLSGMVDYRIDLNNGEKTDWKTVSGLSEETVKGGGRIMFRTRMSNVPMSDIQNALRVEFRSLADNELLGSHIVRYYSVDMLNGPEAKEIAISFNENGNNEFSEAVAEFFHQQGAGLYINTAGQFTLGQSPRDWDGYYNSNPGIELGEKGSLKVEGKTGTDLTFGIVGGKDTNSRLFVNDLEISAYLAGKKILTQKLEEAGQYVSNTYEISLQSIIDDIELYDLFADGQGSLNIFVKCIKEVNDDNGDDAPSTYPFIYKMNYLLKGTSDITTGVINGVTLENGYAKECIYDGYLDNYDVSGTLTRKNSLSDVTLTVKAEINGYVLGSTDIRFRQGETKASFVIHKNMTVSNVHLAGEGMTYEISVN